MPPKPKKPKVREADLVSFTTRAMAAYGILGWRMPISPVIRNQGERKIFCPSPLKGFPDFCGVDATGHMWALELKATDGRTSLEQDEWAKALERRHVRYLEARTIDEIDAFLRSLAGDIYP